jgi:CRISPR-associated protein Cas5d
MFHGFDYPDETGGEDFEARFWRPVMRKGIVDFPRPEECDIRKKIRPMKAKIFHPEKNFSGCREEELARLLGEPVSPAYPDARSLLEGDNA